MIASLDAQQSLVEIEHALFKSFPFSSTSIGVDDSIILDAERGQA